MNWKCNFSYKHYFEVLDHAKKKYTIGTIKEFRKLKKKNKSIILRHDIDYSLEYALKLAEEENAHDLKSTYFVMLHNSFYNALSEESIAIIKKISHLGHDVGLHYDTVFLPKSRSEALRTIRKEVTILQDICKKEIISVAQHNPTINPKLKYNIAIDFLDARSSEIINDYRYLSDSVQNWRDGCMCNHIDKDDKLQILTHPIWWSDKHKLRDLILDELVKKESDRVRMIIESYRQIYVQYLKKNSKR
jgi:hypothetical protein